ncbi:MAG: HupE/UreJ family protein [Opitutales bacterium]
MSHWLQASSVKMWAAIPGALLLAALLVAPAGAHPQWKEANCIAVVDDSGKLTLTVKFDVPSFLTGKLPQEAPVAELDALMTAPRALEDAISPARDKFAKSLKVTADGERVDVELRQFPEAEAIRAQSARQGEVDRYPVLLNARLAAKIPAGTRRVEMTFPAELGTVFTNFRKGMEYQVVTAVVPGEAGVFDVELPGGGVLRFFGSGFLHVAPMGWDHCLFMLAMLLCAETLRIALLRSLIFTLGHAVTLSLVATGTLPPTGPWIEPVIALTIAWAGYEAWRGAVVKARWVVPLAFGLVHGLGFAAAASERLTGWDSSDIAGLLVGFNLGVESAHVVVILTASLLLGLAAARRPDVDFKRPLSALVAAAGVILFVAALLGPAI